MGGGPTALLHLVDCRVDDVPVQSLHGFPNYAVDPVTPQVSWDRTSDGT